MALVAAALVATAVGVTGCVSGTTQIADPGVFQFGDGWVVASSDNGAPGNGPSMPVWAFNGDNLAHPTFLGHVLAHAPSWANPNAAIWAPQIYSVGGRTVAYYSALADSAHGGQRCIGMAISTGLTNFSDVGTPFCSPQGYGLIDPSLFKDGANNYLLFKRDVVQGTGTKVIAITPAGADGLHPSLPTYQILSPTQPWEKTGWSSVEAPTMIEHGGSYYLFYSGNLYNTTRYGVGVARCGSPICDFDNDKFVFNPILTSSSGSQYCGVGGQDVSNGGGLLWFHAYEDGASGSTCNQNRYRYIGGDALDWSSGWPIPQHPRI